MLLTVGPSLGGYVIAILCLLVAYSLLRREVRTNFQKYFIERDNVRTFHKGRQREMTTTLAGHIGRSINSNLWFGFRNHFE